MVGLLDAVGRPTGNYSILKNFLGWERFSSRAGIGGQVHDVHLSRYGLLYRKHLISARSGVCGHGQRLVVRMSVHTGEVTTLAPQSEASSPADGNGSVRAIETATAEVSPLIFRIRRNVQTDGKNGTLVEVQARNERRGTRPGNRVLCLRVARTPGFSCW